MTRYFPDQHIWGSIDSWSNYFWSKQHLYFRTGASIPLRPWSKIPHRWPFPSLSPLLCPFAALRNGGPSEWRPFGMAGRHRFPLPLNRRRCGAIWAPPLGVWGEVPAAKRFSGLTVAHMIAGCSIFRRSDYGQNKQFQMFFFRTWYGMI